MSTNLKKFFNIILIIAIYILTSEFAFSTELTTDQITAAGNNGMIEAMCFVFDMMTGTFGRIIMALFVVGMGWGFITGEIKDYKMIFTFSIAISLSLGSVQIANLISGNNYSCDMFRENKELEENTIYNAGICLVSNIEEYYPGQEWRVCQNYSDVNTCNVLVKNTTHISDNSNNIVTLYECQENYLKKNKKAYIMYECLSNGTLNRLSTDNDLDFGSCKKACKYSDLRTINIRYNFDSSTQVIDENNGYEEEGNYPEGTIINVNCKNQYYEYNNENERDDNGVSIVCESDGNFIVNGNCKPKCDLKDTSYYKTVALWNKCEDNNCTPTNETEFFYGETIEINQCNENYLLTSGETSLKLKCGNSGSWEIENDGKQCSKTCNIKDINNYEFSKIGYCPTDGICNREIFDNKETFYPGDSLVGVYSCSEGYDFNYGSEESARYSCQTDGSWKNINKGYECYKTCNLSDITGYENATEWSYCENKSGDNCKILPTDVSLIKSGFMLKASACKSGYSISPYSPSIFTCTDGKFSTSHQKTGICNKSCKFSELKLIATENDYGLTLTSNASAFIRSKSNGYFVDNDKNDVYDEIVNINTITDNDYASLDSYYTIYECNEGYSTDIEENPIIFYCDTQYGWNLHKNKENICKANCLKTSLPTDTNVLNWVYKDENEKYIDFSLSSVKNGTIVKPNSCKTGYSISSTNTSYYVCDNGIFKENNLNGALTVKTICSVD